MVLFVNRLGKRLTQEINGDGGSSDGLLYCWSDGLKVAMKGMRVGLLKVLLCKFSCKTLKQIQRAGDIPRILTLHNKTVNKR